MPPDIRSACDGVRLWGRRWECGAGDCKGSANEAPSRESGCIRTAFGAHSGPPQRGIDARPSAQTRRTRSGNVENQNVTTIPGVFNNLGTTDARYSTAKTLCLIDLPDI